jgi:L-threonylcarbamoyladenylate synthase
MITTDIQLIKQYLMNHEVVGFPTETVYGLAGNAFDEIAIKKIFDLKQRPTTNPLIIHIKSFDYIHEIAENIPEIATTLAQHFWPGSLTLILNKKKHISKLVTAGKDTVAVRIPNHIQALSLLNILDFPLAAPSANPYGRISSTNSQHVEHYFMKEQIPILEGGSCENGLESTIIGFENNKPVIYRLGSISVEEIEKCIGNVTIKNVQNKKIYAPGMSIHHYAPITPLHLTQDISEAIRMYEGKKMGLLLFKEKYDLTFVKKEITLSEKGDLKEASKNLFKSLHILDNLDLDVIIVEKMPNKNLGRTINDRLMRASNTIN